MAQIYNSCIKFSGLGKKLLTIFLQPVVLTGQHKTQVDYSIYKQDWLILLIFPNSKLSHNYGHHIRHLIIGKTLSR